MDERQAHAVRNPLTDTATQRIEDWRLIEPQRDGNLLVSVLAVDR